MPTRVAFRPNGECLVGHLAQAHRTGGIHDMKVLLGKSFESQTDFIQEHEASWPFTVVDSAFHRCFIDV